MFTIAGGFAAAIALWINWRDRVNNRKPVITVVMDSAHSLSASNSGEVYALNAMAHLTLVGTTLRQGPNDAEVTKSAAGDASMTVRLGDIPPWDERQINNLEPKLGRLLWSQIGADPQWPEFELQNALKLDQRVHIQVKYTEPHHGRTQTAEGKFTRRSILFAAPQHKKSDNTHHLVNLTVERGDKF